MQMYFSQLPYGAAFRQGLGTAVMVKLEGRQARCWHGDAHFTTGEVYEIGDSVPVFLDRSKVSSEALQAYGAKTVAGLRDALRAALGLLPEPVTAETHGDTLVVMGGGDHAYVLMPAVEERKSILGVMQVAGWGVYRLVLTDAEPDYQLVAEAGRCHEAIRTVLTCLFEDLCRHRIVGPLPCESA